MDRESLRSQGITHVVFCTTGSSEQHRDAGVRYLTLKFEDDERFELAPMVVLAVDFVGSARAAGATILIASDRGVSRCAAVATGVLVQLLNVSLRDAFSLVRDAHKKAQPIPGFVAALKRQLAHYPLPVDDVPGDDNDKNDKNDDNDADQPTESATSTTPAAAPAEAPEVAAEVASSSSSSAPPPAAAVAASASTDGGPRRVPFCYTCRMCGQALFKPEHIRGHDQMEGKSDKFEGKDPSLVPGTDQCRLYFVEQLKWMNLPPGELDGTLACPKCHGKLGSFRWRGAQCACGRWCAPAFRILMDRVDERCVDLP